MLEKIESSASWKEFVKELEIVCKEQDVSLPDLVEWIRNLIPQIEKKKFDHYITPETPPNFPKQKLDIVMLVDNHLQGFTITEKKKEYYIYSIERILNLTEEISGDLISFKLLMGPMIGVTITDKVTNSTGLRKFYRKVLNLAWGN